MHLCDWHMHSKHSPCGSPLSSMDAVYRRAKEQGLEEFGVTDHLHCRLNLPALRQGRAQYDALTEKSGFHFGLEVSCLRPYDHRLNDARGEAGSLFGEQPGGPEEPPTLFLPDGLVEELKVEYVIGGAHWPLGAPLEREAIIRSYHRQNMFLATHPQVDIVAHPWWWMGAWKGDDEIYHTLPWFDDFGVIPNSMHDEFAAAARESGTAVEINAGATLLHKPYPAHFRPQYVEYLAFLKERGVTFSLGSDNHGKRVALLSDIVCDLETLGLRSEDLWRPAMAKRMRRK